jgi:hypothetical protein
VGSVRGGGKVMQETVAQLGELDADGRANARLLPQQITGADQQRELVEAAASEERRIAGPARSSVRAGLAGHGWDGSCDARSSWRNYAQS